MNEPITDFDALSDAFADGLPCYATFSGTHGDQYKVITRRCGVRPRVVAIQLAPVPQIGLDGDVWVQFNEPSIKWLCEPKVESVSIPIPRSFAYLCEAAEVSPETVLKGLIADLCGLENCEDSDFRSHGSDERSAARGWFNRVMWGGK